MPKYGVFSGLYFPAFRLNTETDQKNSVFGQFSQSLKLSASQSSVSRNCYYSEFQRELNSATHFEQFSAACRQVKDKDFRSLLDVVKQMNTYEKTHISQVIDLFKLILMLPATKASSQISFSLLRHVKSYLSATTGQGRLIHLMILSAYNENDDELILKNVPREFIHKNETRISFLGKI